MIVRITLRTDKNENITMLFGNSYKKWHQQFQEYLWMYITWWDTKIIMKCEVREIIKVEKSKSEWKGFGGLKWCSDESFQEELNREGVQRGEPDNPNPRKYSEMQFYSDSAITSKVKSMLVERLRHLDNAGDDKINEELASHIEKIKEIRNKEKQLS